MPNSMKGQHKQGEGVSRSERNWKRVEESTATCVNTSKALNQYNTRLWALGYDKPTADHTDISRQQHGNNDANLRVCLHCFLSNYLLRPNYAEHFVDILFVCLLFEPVTHFEAWAGLELSTSCLSLPSAGITGIYNYA